MSARVDPLAIGRALALILEQPAQLQAPSRPMVPMSLGARVRATAWDDPPPFAPTDLADYLGRVLPAIARRVAQWSERSVGPVLPLVPEELPVKREDSP